jgi:2-keto-3-deoxy-L-rhamnonate aldolase RhmA
MTAEATATAVRVTGVRSTAGVGAFTGRRWPADGPAGWDSCPAASCHRRCRPACPASNEVLGAHRIQIESVETVTNLARLVRPGITHVTWGPSDLEFSLELQPEYPLRMVEACMQHVAEQLEGTGIRMAMGEASAAAERR